MKRPLVAIGLAIAALGAQAHRDRLFSLAADGSIPELPAPYAATRLKIDLGAGTPARIVGIAIAVPGHDVRVSSCVLAKIPPTSRDRVTLKGSWYHDLAALPPYVDVRIQADAQAARPSDSEGVELLFSLVDGQLMSARRWVAAARTTTSSDLGCDHAG